MRGSCYTPPLIRHRLDFAVVAAHDRPNRHPFRSVSDRFPPLWRRPYCPVQLALCARPRRL